MSNNNKVTQKRKLIIESKVMNNNNEPNENLEAEVNHKSKSPNSNSLDFSNNIPFQKAKSISSNNVLINGKFDKEMENSNSRRRERNITVSVKKPLKKMDKETPNASKSKFKINLKNKKSNLKKTIRQNSNPDLRKHIQINPLAELVNITQKPNDTQSADDIKNNENTCAEEEDLMNENNNELDYHIYNDDSINEELIDYFDTDNNDFNEFLKYKSESFVTQHTHLFKGILRNLLLFGVVSNFNKRTQFK